MDRADDVVEADLRHICARLPEEFLRLSGKRLLITGGAGFLGYYLVQSPLYWNATNGHRPSIDVTVYDNFIRGAPTWLTSMAARREDLRLRRHDMRSPLPDTMPNFDFIMHAASIASPTYYRRYPIETMTANVNGLHSLLEYASRRGEAKQPVAGLLFFSTSEIYGDPSPDQIPTREAYPGNVSCTGPRACYDESKRYGETLCVNFAAKHSVPVKTVRPFNNYGPGLKITDRRVVPDFARSVLEQRPIVMHSDGSPTRTFCYVADAVVGYYKALIHGRDGQPYNIGVEEPEISIAEVAEKIAVLGRELFDYDGDVIHQSSLEGNYLVDNPKRRCPSIEKAKSELGYQPEIELDEGLKRSLLWYSEHRSAEEK